jgi:hypothetical protein
MADYFGRQDSKHQGQGAAAKGKHEVVADTGPVLRGLVSGYLALVMPNVHARQLVNIPMSVEQSQA